MASKCSSNCYWSLWLAVRNPERGRVKSLLSMYPLSSHSFSLTFSKKEVFFKGPRLSVLVSVIMNLSSSPLSLMITCCLNPKNHPMEYLPHWSIPWNPVVNSLIIIDLQRNRIHVVNANAFPKKTSLMKTSRWNRIDFYNSTKRLLEANQVINVTDTNILTLCRNVWCRRIHLNEILWDLS